MSDNGNELLPSDLQLKVNQLEQTIQQLKLNSLSSSRVRLASMLGETHQGARDTYEIFGWEKTPNFYHFNNAYTRTVGGSAIDKIAERTWVKPPKISEDGDENTDFVTAVNELFERLKAWSVLSKVDVLSGIGNLALLLIGVGNINKSTEVTDTAEIEKLKAIEKAKKHSFQELLKTVTNNRSDKSDKELNINQPASQVLSQPIAPNSLNNPDDILFFTPYSEIAIDNIVWNNDPNSPRFGLPEFYTVSIAGGSDVSKTSLDTRGSTQGIIHWSRIISVAQNTLDNPTIGRSSLLRALNTLSDIDKVVGGGAEAMWLLINRGMAFLLDDTLPMSEDEKSDMKDEIEDYVNQLTRFMTLRNIDIKTLGTDVPDIKDNAEVLFQKAAGELGIPTRILFGSERGELASSQDEKNLASTVSSRQSRWAEPDLVRPLIDRMILFGAVPAPKSGSYTLGTKDDKGQYQWPSTLELSPEQEADIAQRRSEALKTAHDAQFLGAEVTDEEVREYGGLTAEPQDEMSGEPGVDFSKDMQKEIESDN